MERNDKSRFIITSTRSGMLNGFSIRPGGAKIIIDTKGRLPYKLQRRKDFLKK
jgi:hypothetical protein